MRSENVFGLIKSSHSPWTTFLGGSQFLDGTRHEPKFRTLQTYREVKTLREFYHGRCAQGASVKAAESSIDFSGDAKMQSTGRR